MGRIHTRIEENVTKTILARKKFSKTTTRKYKATKRMVTRAKIHENNVAKKVVIIKGLAANWYFNLLLGSITSWKHFTNLFLNHFRFNFKTQRSQQAFSLLRRVKESS